MEFCYNCRPLNYLTLKQIKAQMVYNLQRPGLKELEDFWFKLKFNRCNWKDIFLLLLPDTLKIKGNF